MSVTFAGQLLREATRIGGPPILTAIAGVAWEIVESSQKASHHRTAFQSLAQRVAELVHTVTHSFETLKDSNDLNNLPDDLLRFLDDLGYKLLTINEFVKSRLKQGRLKAFVYQDRDTTALAQFQEDIKHALDVFNTRSSIAIQSHDALKIRSEDEHNVLRLLDSHVEELDEYLAKKKAASESSKTGTAAVSRANVPPRQAVIFGRDSEVQTICKLIRDGGARVAVLGAPGMGKTSVALAVVHDPSVEQRFGIRRVFIACDAADDANSLLSIIGGVLGITASSNAAQRKDILKWLGAAPTLLVLDNFESPWDPPATRTAVEDLITTLSTVPDLTLLITLRGAERPNGPAWTRPFLPPLSPLPLDASRQVFSTISDIDEDPALLELLTLADGLPLAIRLLAGMASYESCTSLLERWNKLDAPILARGTNRLSNLEISISLSLSSPRMTLVPHAEELLSLLSLLPDGLRAEDMTTTCDIPGAGRCAVVLLRTGLAYRATDDDRVRVLAPIRASMLRRHPPSSDALARMYTRYGAAGRAAPGYPDIDVQHLEIITHELGNTEAVLRHALTHAPDEDALRAVSGLALLHQRTSLGSMTLIHAAIAAARQLGMKELLVDCLLHRSGMTYGKQAHEQWTALVNEAVAVSEEVGYTYGYVTAKCRLLDRENRATAAECARLLAMARTTDDSTLLVATLLALGRVHESMTQLETAKAHYAEAADVCRGMDKPEPGHFAMAIGHLGDILAVQGHVAEALPLFKEGAEMAGRAKRIVDEAHCQRQIGTAYMSLWEYRSAIKYLTIGRQLYHSGGFTFLEAASLSHIAWSQTMVGDLSAAAQSVDDAASIIGKMANPWVFGSTLTAFVRGDIALYERDYEQASALFAHVRATYSRISLRDYEAEVLKRQGFLALLQGYKDNAEGCFILSAILNRKTQEFLNISLALHRLADVWLAQGDEASSIKLTYAVGPQLVRLNNKKELADVQLRFAYIAKQRQDTNRAQTLAEKALLEYNRLEWAYGAEQCQQLLQS